MYVCRQIIRRGFLFAVFTLSRLSWNVTVAVADYSSEVEPVVF